MSQHSNLERPSFLLGLTEGGRAAIELFTYLPFNALRKLDKVGDGHPVLVLPGFMATDLSTVPLRNYIYDIYISVHPSVALAYIHYFPLYFRCAHSTIG